MKKLFNGRFLFILISSLIGLILLALGAFYLFDDEDDTFIKSGYVLNPLSSTSEKYFFDENTGYKENLSSMIEFVDVDDKNVSILKDSFLHYDDESISFLKKGALLDLDTIEGTNAVSFYNITNKSMIEKKDSGYFIESAAGDIRLINFIGRISDDKYIVVGDLSLKMAGNDTTIKGDYFEVVYVEEGIINVENKNVKYQVTADDTLIYIGNDTVVDFGDKKITVDGEDLMSITAITIDGDENIEIIPKGNEDEETEEDENDTAGDNGENNIGDGLGQGDNGTGEDGTGGEIIGEVEDEVVVTLKNAKSGSTNIDVIFDVINAKEDDIFKLQVVNLNSGRTVDIEAEVLADVEIKVNLLTPNTKYLFMVINKKDNGKYFQKVLETTGFGIKMEKAYATESSLVYKVTIDEGTDITNAKLSLYKFNEETKQNEIVTDGKNEKIINLSSLKENLEGEHEITFDGLESNTIYTAVLDEFSVASSNFKDIYNITITSMTLKKIPKFSEMTISKDVGAGSFDLSLGNIKDPDNAIVSYTYAIYDRLNGEKAINPIVHNNASPITVKIGDDENELKNDTNYYYNVIIEYFDNEKYIEYVTTDSIIFMMGNDPYITIVPNVDLVTHEKMGATIYLTDNSCLISVPGREKCDGASSTIVEVTKVNPLTGERTPIPGGTKEFTFEVTEDEIKYDLVIDDLQPGTTYNIEVKASLNNTDGSEKQEILHTDESKRTIVTKSLSSFIVNWTNNQGSVTHVIDAGIKFKPDEENGTLSPEESINSIEKVIIRLYEGRDLGDLSLQLPIGIKTIRKSNVVNIKSMFYDTTYGLSSLNTFGLTMEALINLSKTGKLSEYYTLSVEAFTDNDYEVNLVDNVYTYRISSLLLMDDVEEPVIKLEGITNKASGNLFENLTNGATYVGYKINAAFDRNQLVANNILPEKINFYVYNKEGKKVKFYIKDSEGNLKEVDKITGDLGENGFYETSLYMGYGTSYETVDSLMSRGNSYYIGYEVEAVADGDKLMYPPAASTDLPSDYGVYEMVTVEKESPSVKMYLAKSDANSVNYSYVISDPDNAIYKEPDSDDYGFYYTVNRVGEKKVNLVKDNTVDYNRFEGRIIIEGLKKGYLYNLYYKKNSAKTGDITKDIVDYVDGSNKGLRMFEGFYDADKDAVSYNFKYKLINNPLKDNKVVIKIMANEDILSRIVSYKISFKDSKGKMLNKELWQLSSCDGDREGDLPRCLSVDYTELKEAGMKSENNVTNTISVSLTALYDNGLAGYDYKVGSESDADYLYCIMQDNSTENGMGNYIVFSQNGSQVTTWSDTLGAPKGYYTYTLNKSLLFYKSQMNSNHRGNISINLSSSGYSSKNGVLNPKMISVDEMDCSTNDDGSCNTFSFNSITPKVAVTEKAPIINGSVLNFTLSGVDLSDIKLESDGNYYLYVRTWDDLSNVGNSSLIARPDVKVKINKDNPTSTVSEMFDGLKENTSYYYNVYAYMNKDGRYVYTQLFDAAIRDNYEISTYEFKTARASDLFHSLSVSHSASDKIYGNRDLNTKINLLAYKNGISFNFDIIYVLCEIGTENCGPDKDDNRIFMKTIPLEKINNTLVSDSFDISEYDLEFDKNYYMYIFAQADYYEDPIKNVIVKRNIVLNRYDVNVKLNKLTEPSFVVTRNASFIDNDYFIDFDIVVNDVDRTLVNGNYFIKLLDSDGNIVGNMQLKDDSGTYYDQANYSEYEFDAFNVRKSVRIKGLKPETQYSFVIYNDVYINNYNEEIPKENRTYEVKRTYTVYSTNNYGVAFGKDITYSATERSIIVTFLGGSNFDNVTEVSYTVGLWDDVESSLTVSGTFVIGENNKYFEMYRDSSDWRFVIDPESMKNTLGKTYEVNISFKVKVPGTDNVIVLTSADVPEFEGKAVYVEDDK